MSCHCCQMRLFYYTFQIPPHTHSHMQSTQPYDSVCCVQLFCTLTVSAGVPAAVTVGRTPLPVMQRIAQENTEEFNLNTLKHI